MNSNGHKMKKHVFVYCEKWQPGGIQVIQAKLAERLQGEAWQFDLAVSEQDTDMFVDDIQNAGAKFIVTLPRKYKGPIRRILANACALYPLLRNGHYDICHFNVCQGVEMVYLFVAMLAGVPVRIAHCRNNGIGAGGKLRGLKILAHEVCKRVFGECATVRIANSDLAAKWMFLPRQIKRGDVLLMDNGIDTERFAFSQAVRERTRRALGVEEGFLIGHIGHFSYQKNHEWVLRVFSAYLKKHAEAKLLLVGTGELEQSVRAQAERLGIESRILFYGATKDVAPLLCAMDVFLFPSRFEGFGNVLIEAQTTGLPCVVSADVIPERVHLLKNYKTVSLRESAETWAAAIEQVTQEDTQKRQSHGDEISKMGLDISSMADRIRTVYIHASEERKP